MQIVDYIYSFVYYICLYKVKKIIDTIAPSPQNALCFLISSDRDHGPSAKNVKF